MTVYYSDATVTVHHGDCLDVLKELADSSVDSVVCDPPYGLEFMGKEWDKFKTGRGEKYSKGGDLNLADIAAQSGKGGAGPVYVSRPAKRCASCGKQAWSGSPCKCEAPEWVMDNSPLHSFQRWCQLWAAECLRVLRPGGHLLAFGGTRTYHRLAVGIEDAGFELRDSCLDINGHPYHNCHNPDCDPLLGVPGLAWLYGSGFPKSLDVSKAIDRAGSGTMRRAKLLHFIEAKGVDAAWLIAQGVADAKSFADWTVEDHCPSDRNWALIRGALGVTDAEESAYERQVLASAHRAATGRMQQGLGGYAFGEDFNLTAPATADAQRWQGFGTSLKPAHEPIVVARKPLSGTVAANVLAHGTGALNVDGCRIGEGGQLKWSTPRGMGSPNSFADDAWTQAQGRPPADPTANPAGRWPANVALDETAAAALDHMSGESAGKGGTTAGWQDEYVGGKYVPIPKTAYEDIGGASRFFYTAKAGSDERITHDGTSHPTVKPLALMRWLVRLVTPPGGIILEPFAGSGTTVEAAILEGFRCIAIEREADYLPLITQRLNRRRDPVAYLTAAGEDLGLFDLDEPAGGVS